jgi:hypothetical protein
MTRRDYPVDVDSLMDEVLGYLAVVTLFCAEGCEPCWREDANFGERKSERPLAAFAPTPNRGGRHDGAQEISP